MCGFFRFLPTKTLCFCRNKAYIICVFCFKLPYLYRKLQSVFIAHSLRFFLATALPSFAHPSGQRGPHSAQSSPGDTHHQPALRLPMVFTKPFDAILRVVPVAQKKFQIPRNKARNVTPGKSSSRLKARYAAVKSGSTRIAEIVLKNPIISAPCSAFYCVFYSACQPPSARAARWSPKAPWVQSRDQFSDRP